jgi:hypothetical protein
MPKLKIITIDRAKWLQGKEKHNGGSFLRRQTDGKKCCLGFALTQCGYKKKVTNIGCPEDLDFPLPAPLKFLLNKKTSGDSGTAVRLMDINDDDRKLTPAKREEKIAKIFAANGLRARFVGKYPKPDAN